MKEDAVATMHLRYHRWAYERILDAAAGLEHELLFRDMRGSFGSLFGALLHSFQTDWTWCSRVSGQADAQLKNAPAAKTLPALRTEWLQVVDGFTELVETLPAKAWKQPVAYQNSQGAAFETPLWQIVFHMVNHGTAYRGQAATLLRQLGATPPNTDLILWYRQL